MTDYFQILTIDAEELSVKFLPRTLYYFSIHQDTREWITENGFKVRFHENAFGWGQYRFENEAQLNAFLLRWR